MGQCVQIYSLCPGHYTEVKRKLQSMTWKIRVRATVINDGTLLSKIYYLSIYHHVTYYRTYMLPFPKKTFSRLHLYNLNTPKQEKSTRWQLCEVTQHHKCNFPLHFKVHILLCQKTHISPVMIIMQNVLLSASQLRHAAIHRDLYRDALKWKFPGQSRNRIWWKNLPNIEQVHSHFSIYFAIFFTISKFK